ncbi:hypothetical protein OROMI_016800 [Orobanche minor]
MKIGNRHSPKVLFPEYLYDTTPEIAKSLDWENGVAGNNDSTYVFVNVPIIILARTHGVVCLCRHKRSIWIYLVRKSKPTIYEDMMNRPNADAMLKSEVANLILERAVDKEQMIKEHERIKQ